MNTEHCMHEVIILGGGFAGLGAAIKLREAGIHDFLLLEKADELGGVFRRIGRDAAGDGCAVEIDDVDGVAAFEATGDGGDAGSQERLAGFEGAGGACIDADRARGAQGAGTGICSGEGGILPEEHAECSRYLYEIASARFGWALEKVAGVQAFHFKFGQGAKTGTGGHLPGLKVVGRIAEVRGLPEGTPAADAVAARNVAVPAAARLPLQPPLRQHVAHRGVHVAARQQGRQGAQVGLQRELHGAGRRGQLAGRGQHGAEAQRQRRQLQRGRPRRAGCRSPGSARSRSPA